jgi:hypothetical protein
MDKARRMLANASKVTGADIEAAVREAGDLCAGRGVSDTVGLDIAYYRLQIRLKCDISELDNEMYQAALKIVRASPLEAPNAKYNGVAKVVQRDSRWAS